ncbi:MAG: 2,5-diamino-6-(ribosylamino)-4(3H)-pyrimidinone 5'-phosphate reductase [Halobacteriaceae archaeon]
MYVHANAAASADGKLAARTREQVALSGPEDFDRVDRLRAAADAVAVGATTVRRDDPSLTVDEDDRVAARERDGRPPQPARVAVSGSAALPTDARLFDDAAETVVLTAADAPEDRVDALRAAGADVVQTPRAGDGIALAEGLSALADRGVESLLVEGGGELLFGLFEAGAVDVFTVFIAPAVVGGRDAPTLADGVGFTDPERFVDLDLQAVERVDDGVLLRYAVGDAEPPAGET